MTNNFYIENEEYTIIYRNGRHEIQLVHYHKENEVVFTGTFEECQKESDKMNIEHLESIIG